MSKILSDGVEKVIKTKRMVTGVKCDICGKVMPIKRDNESRYFRVITGHNDWGNESCESIEQKEICPNCIDKFVSKYLQDVEGTEYINIETEYAVAEAKWEVDVS